MDKIVLYSSKVFLSEENSNPDSYIAKFIICDFGRNKNGVSIDREHIEEWLSTLKNKPLVGKIKIRNDGEYDFTGHNVKIVNKKDENGNKYQDVVFDTSAFGSFFDVAIETIDDKEYIVATCEIWKRFSQACDIIVNRIQEGTLYTSWEISVEKARQGIIDGMATKIIEMGRFMGHCLLSKYVEPAYDSSCLLEIASTEYKDTEFEEALSQDFIGQAVSEHNSTKKEENGLANNIETSNNEEVVEVVEEVVVENAETGTEVVEEVATEEVENSGEVSEVQEVSELTVWDLRAKIESACREKHGDYCWVSFWFPESHTVWCEFHGRKSELDYLLFTYEVADDEVTVSEPELVTLTVNVSEINSTLAAKDEALVKASEEINSLKDEIASLQPYKDAADKAELEKAEAEKAEKRNALKSYALKSKFITESEFNKEDEKYNAELAEMIENLDEVSVNNIIAARFMASLNQSEVETSEVHTAETNVSTDLNAEEDEQKVYINPVQAFLN